LDDLRVYKRALSATEISDLSTDIVPVVITQQPTAQSVCPGSTVAFSVSAAGSGTLTYWWQKANVNITDGGHYSGTSTATLTVSSCDVVDVASYRCVVSNSWGSVDSNAVSLTLKVATAITQQPQSQAISVGGTAILTISATGGGTLGYQWQKNGSNVTDGGHYTGCTTATLTISRADSSDAASYRCVVTGGCGSATSNQAALTVGSPAAPGDFDHDGDVDQEDFGAFQLCLGLPGSGDCWWADLGGNSTVDQLDLTILLHCLSGANVPADVGCAN
jgi:hypothetical protein